MTNKKEAPKQQPVCGIVMPISAMEYDGHEYSEKHWNDIRKLICDAAEKLDFEARLVSEKDEANIIQKTIVQNLYNDDIVICDISAKNSNVMFELGLRCAFDKPVIVIKDKETGFSFDTSPFKHIEYDRELGYSEIIRLQKEIQTAIKATHKESQSESYSPFLRTFGEFTPQNLEINEVDKFEYLQESIEQLSHDIQRIKSDEFAYNPLALLRDELEPKDNINPKALSAFLSERELEIFAMTGNGFSSHEIGRKFNVSPKTIDSYKSRIVSKLNLEDGRDLLKLAIKANRQNPNI